MYFKLSEKNHNGISQIKKKNTLNLLDIGSKLGIITIFVVADVVWCSILSVYTDVSDYLRIKFNIPSSSDLLANVIKSKAISCTIFKGPPFCYSTY